MTVPIVHLSLSKPKAKLSPPRVLKVDRIRAQAAYPQAVSYLYACALGAETDRFEAPLVDLRDIHPGIRAQLEEETVRAVRILDPIAEACARKFARAAAIERVQVILAAHVDHKPEYLRERAGEIADAVLAIYRSHLIDGMGGVS